MPARDLAVQVLQELLIDARAPELDAKLGQAELLLSSVRTSDFAFRYGGEEFVVVFGNVDVRAALAVADKI